MVLAERLIYFNVIIWLIIPELRGERNQVDIYFRVNYYFNVIIKDSAPAQGERVQIFAGALRAPAYIY